jgi:hypothetical protein
LHTKDNNSVWLDIKSINTRKNIRDFIKFSSQFDEDTQLQLRNIFKEAQKIIDEELKKEKDQSILD